VSSALRYRADIDGLRGVAVASVIAYHLRPAWLPGGFAGVDVFFVISGYLITGILLTRDELTLGEFYRRRIARILPALILVLLASSALAWAFLFRDEFDEFLKYTAGSAAFIINIQLFRDAGYFDPVGWSKPLLHLWSLGVEEQFYLAWPPMLLLLSRVRRQWVAPFTVVVAVASLVGAVTMSGTSPVASFFLPVTRLWELLIGAFLAQRTFVNPFRLSPAMEVFCSAVGAICIAAAFVSPDADDAWPGILTLVPTLGAALLLLAGENAWVNANLLSAKWLVGLGLISYPLYLWHWPLLSFGRIVGLGPSAAIRGLSSLVLIGVAVVLSVLTYRYLEKSARSRPTWRTAAILMSALAGVGVLALIARFRKLPTRLDSPATLAVAEARRDRPPFVHEQTTITMVAPGRAGDTVLLLGDSHINQYWGRVETFHNARLDLPAVLLFSRVNCPMLPRVELRDSFACRRRYDEALARASGPGIRTVVFATYWARPFRTDTFAYRGSRAPLQLRTPIADSVFAQMSRDLGSLVRAGKRVFIILPNPGGPTMDLKKLLPERLGRGDVPVPAPASRRLVAAWSDDVANELRVVARNAGATVLDPFDYFCDKETCGPFVGGAPMNQDDNHVRYSFAGRRATFIDSAVLAPPSRR
jgi:peptidoglycan/LPS O-acetylase OafA/YrhL